MAARIRLSPLSETDAADFVKAARASRVLHGAWVSPPQDRTAFIARLKRLQTMGDHAFAVRHRATGELAGCIEVTQIIRGPLQSAYLGYYAFAGHQRQGLMTEALLQVVRLAFGRLGLHRLEANMQPGNAASIALARACGFTQEGYSPRYLKIRGRWRDHERWARVRD